MSFSGSLNIPRTGDKMDCICWHVHFSGTDLYLPTVFFFFFLKSEMLIRLRTSTLYHLLLMALVTLHLYSFSKLGNYQKNETCITQVCEALGIQRQVRSDTCQDLTVLGDRKRGRDEVVQYNKKKKKTQAGH